MKPSCSSSTTSALELRRFCLSTSDHEILRSRCVQEINVHGIMSLCSHVHHALTVPVVCACLWNTTSWWKLSKQKSICFDVDDWYDGIGGSTMRPCGGLHWACSYADVNVHPLHSRTISSGLKVANFWSPGHGETCCFHLLGVFPHRDCRRSNFFVKQEYNRSASRRRPSWVT